jgi:putative Mn2+ efflux pump MntP
MLTLIFLAVALAADGFAVSICRGANSTNRWSIAVGTGLAFGIMHVVMIILGWLIGDILEAWKEFAPWIAFAVLFLLGGKMINEAVMHEVDPIEFKKADNRWLAFMGLVSASIATSIDGLAAGVTLPLLGLPLAIDAAVIGGLTGLLCVAGYKAGALIGARWGNYATMAGGVVLIIIAFKTVLLG